MSGGWSLRGELVLSCSCTVFCPCTLSLGQAPPTEEHCQTWAGIRIDEYRLEGATRTFSVGKLIDGAVTPIAGKNKGEPVVIRNSEYWVAPDITVSRADKSRVRAFGRNWNFAGRSAEICQLDWGN